LDVIPDLLLIVALIAKDNLGLTWWQILQVGFSLGVEIAFVFLPVAELDGVGVIDRR
jgi:hypothetical protein